MQHQIPLKRFEYCIADPRISSTFDIDFENRSLSFDNEGIKVTAGISPGFGVDLSDQTDHALVFSLEGILEDGKTVNPCSGLLVLQNYRQWYGRSGAEWRLAVYLYDDVNDDREIKFDMWSSPLSATAALN